MLRTFQVTLMVPLLACWCAGCRRSTGTTAPANQLSDWVQLADPGRAERIYLDGLVSDAMNEPVVIAVRLSLRASGRTIE